MRAINNVAIPDNIVLLGLFSFLFPLLLPRCCEPSLHPLSGCLSPNITQDSLV